MYIWNLIKAWEIMIVRYADRSLSQKGILRITSEDIRKTENSNVKHVALNFTDQPNWKIINTTKWDVWKINN